MLRIVRVRFSFPQLLLFTSLAGSVALPAHSVWWGYSPPDAAVTLTASRNTVLSGQSFFYDLEVVTRGSAANGRVPVQLVLPEGIELVSSSYGYQLVGRTLRFELYSIRVRVMVRAERTFGPVTSVASVTVANDSDPTNNRASATVTVNSWRLRGVSVFPLEVPFMGPTLWIGAHPDDEILVSAFLGALCAEREQICTLISATHGEAGVCLIPGGCSPSLAAVRELEFQRSAAILRAYPIIGEFRDGSAPTPEGVLAIWAAQAGGEEILIQLAVGEIRKSGARFVLTFDPRHGSTCHPDHRAIGALVLRAIERMGADAPALFFIETRLLQSPIGDAPSLGRVAPDDASQLVFNGDQWAPRIYGSLWRYVAFVIATHVSQFEQRLAVSLGTAPQPERMLGLLPSAQVKPDPRYDICR